ncbi:hypothetical protein [Streptomyces leeuwenhoekii]|uniref:Uncharacterized protein n=1 Tax=Streptomyces leeuwenhoekii TaxID=1437453 RepID=A0A0F7W1C1_STRLW|nr:hypothetical protein [Streptomyces leeuwenhoekii]KMS81914.1 hypothetical protein ACH49_00250 [Streptomyces leeuwenhoekii]CQR64608.1 Hypothetical Protein SCAB [Streptomyces leeuwenhoekii]
MELPLPETLRRLRECPEGSDLSPKELARETALPERTVRALLNGRAAPFDTVEERVCARVRTLAEAYLVRTRERMGDLVSAVHRELGVSEVWARKILKGEKVPSVSLLHGLARFFRVEAGESFFTAPADAALNRVLLRRLRTIEEPDPVQALMEKYGVVRTDLRSHCAMTPEQLEKLLAGVIRSVVPTKATDDER